jgi:hypothetical protein
VTLAMQFHTCALFSSGAVSCWGSNSYGQVTLVVRFGGAVVCWGWRCVCHADDAVLVAQIGDGTTSNRHTPVAIASLSSGVAIIAANDVRCFLGCFFWSYFCEMALSV